MAKSYEDVMAENRDAKEKNRQLRTANELKYQAAKELRNTPQTLEQRQESQKQRKITDERIKGLQQEAESAAGVPSDIADQLQTSRNQKAAADYESNRNLGYKKGGAIKSKCACGGGKMAKGGKVSSASKRADGIAIRGKTRA